MLFGKSVNKYYGKYFHMFLIGIIALIVVDIAQLKIPECYGNLIDYLEQKTLTEALLKDIMITLIIVIILMFTGRFLWRVTIFGVSIRIESDLRQKMFRHTESLSQTYFQNNKTGAQMALYTNDLQSIRACFGSGLIMLIDAFFLGSISFYKMFVLDWKLTLISAIPLIILALCGGIIGKYMSKKHEERQKAYADMSDFAQENFSGISVIKAFVKEAKELKVFAKINKNNEDKNMAFIKFGILLDVLIELLVASIIAIITGYGSYLVIMGKETGVVTFTIGDMSKFISYFTAMLWPMIALGQLINLRAQGKASLKRIDELLKQIPDVKDDKDLIEVPLEGEITFSHLTFHYPNPNKEEERDVLTDISFNIKKGEHVGIIGKTGCGKTTIVDLLMRMYNVPTSSILIDNYDIMKLRIKDVRNLFAYVPQDNFLFATSVLKNISFAKEKPLSLDLARKYGELAAVDDNIIEFTEGYDTILGERGVTVSGGQKQRISIARALAKEGKVLILDDSVAAVDTKTESTILNNLKEYGKDRTIIMIAHRVSTIEDMDKIILMDQGKIIGIGTHDELLRNEPMYQDIVNLQHLEDKLEGGDN